MSGSAPRREAWAVLATIAAAACVALVAASQPRVSAPDARVSGADTPAASALALVALAALAAFLLLPTTGRRAVASLLVLVGLGIVAAMLTIPADATWFSYGETAPEFHRSRWSWLGASAGIAIAVAAGWAVVRARAWPPLRRTLDSNTAVRTERRRSTWDAIDAGEDPTIDS